MVSRKTALAIPAPLATLAIMFLGTNAAFAQDSYNSQLSNFTKTSFYAGFLGHVFTSVPGEVFTRCPALQSPGSRVTILKAGNFSVDGHPTSGVWRQDFPVSGCGNDTILHFYFQATPDEKINSLFAIPGATHADLKLQADALKYAKSQVSGKDATCEHVYVLNSQFDGYNSPPSTVAGPAARRAWRETWTLIACGRSYTVPMTFVPDATGTTIGAAPAEAN